jgi:pimeloyl-ACP methyl ester carboxylesterase
MWTDLAGSLSETANTVSLDLRGHGRSPGAGRSTIEEHARDVVDLVRRLDTPLPVPCGLSMGGAVVQQLLVVHPEDFPAGILMNTGPKLKVMPLIFDTIARDYGAFVDLLCRTAVHAGNFSPELREKIVQVTRCEPETALRDFRACDRFDLMERIGSIRVPVLVISGEEDLITPPRYGEFLAGAIPGAVHARLTGTGHLSPLERPGEVCRVIREFLEYPAIRRTRAADTAP